MSNAVYTIRWLNTTRHWGMILIIIHWLSALTVFGLFGLGLWMVDLGYYDSWYNKAPNLHKNVGILLFTFTLMRLLWRQFNRYPEPLETHSRRERSLAMSMHNILYILLMLVMLSGYLISTADGHAISIFNGFQLPALIYGIEQQGDVAGVVHLWLAISLIGVTVLHALATIKHHFFDRDRTLKRMFGF